MPKGPAPRSIIDRIESKLVPEGSCLVYTGGKDQYGYGLIWDNIKRTKVRVTRTLFKHYKGDIPEGHVIRHTCDNPPCGKLDHLISGTQQQNIADMVKRGRASSRPGESHPNAVLTEEDVLTIRRLREEDNLTYKVLAEKFCVSSSLIACVVTRRSWKHL